MVVHTSAVPRRWIDAADNGAECAPDGDANEARADVRGA